MSGLIKYTHLYHYTTFESAVKIIASRRLLFSNIEKVNDINELRGPVVLSDERYQEEISNCLKDYSQLSLTMDTMDHFGFDIPAMWGHYAQNGQGVCLMLDKVMFDREAYNRGFYYNVVHYGPRESLSDLYYDARYGTVCDYISNSVQTLFFHKTEDWKYEQEYRVVSLRDRGQFIDIGGSLVGIILCAKSRDLLLRSVEYCALHAVGSDLDFYRYCTSLGQQWELFDINDKSIKKPIIYDLINLKSIKE